MSPQPARGDAPVPRPETPVLVAVFLCQGCFTFSRGLLGRASVDCECGGRRRVLRVIPDQRTKDVPVAFDRRRAQD